MVFDVAVVHTCALDTDLLQAPTASAPAFSAGCAGHAHGTPLQPEHCGCHGRTSEACVAVRLVVPQRIVEWIGPASAGHPRWSVRHLDHPPHLNG